MLKIEVMISSEDVMKLLKISRPTLYNYRTQKDDPIPHFVMKGEVRFYLSEIMKWVSRR